MNAELLRRFAENDPTIIALFLYYKGIDDDDAQVIAETLKSNTAVTKLYLGNNAIRDAGAIALANALKTNTVLSNLVLDNNKIRADGAAALVSSALTLTVLELNGNRFGDVGAAAVARALKTNTTLQRLGLGGNKIGTVDIIVVLKTNTTLMDVTLRRNHIEDADAIAEMLKTNTTLVRLDLADNAIDEAGARIIGEGLRSNGLRTTPLELILFDYQDYMYPIQEDINKIAKKIVERNRRAHQRVRDIIYRITQKPYIEGVPRDVARTIAAELWETRGDPVWWTEEEGGTFGKEAPPKRARTQSCIQCVVRGAAWQERESPARVFCGSYCQVLHHTGLPDLRGMTAEQAERALGILRGI